MYPTVVLVHSWLRWVVLLLALLAVSRAISGMKAGRPWTPADERTGRLFVTTLDLQVALGLLLYFLLSPITHEALRDFGAAMKIPAMRYWAVEHGFGMLVGAAFAHVGRARARKIAEPARKHKTIAIFVALSLLAILISIPWPGMPNARPLIRW